MLTSILHQFLDDVQDRACSHDNSPERRTLLAHNPHSTRLDTLLSTLRASCPRMHHSLNVSAASVASVQDVVDDDSASCTDTLKLASFTALVADKANIFNVDRTHVRVRRHPSTHTVVDCFSKHNILDVVSLHAF